MTTAQIIEIEAGQNIVLDMDGHSITVADDFAGRPIWNYGTLTVTGNGTIDSSASNTGGYGAIDNYGTLTIENGTYTGSVNASGASIKNRPDGVLTIQNGTFNGAATAVYNAGIATIYNGLFDCRSCSACNRQSWGYTIQSHMDVDGKTPELYFYDGTVIGVQGGFSCSAGYAEIRNGTFKTVSCATHTGGSSAWYALYVAGEDADVKCVVYDGYFESASKTTALIGNDNTDGDGGINANATSEIKGGTFVAPAGQKAVTGAPNTGNPVISGGSFSSDVSDYISGDCEIVQRDGQWVVGTEDELAVAQTEDGEKYLSLEDAVTTAQPGETIKLLDNVTLPGRLAVSKDLRIDMNGKTISVAGTSTHGISVVNGGSLELTGSGTMRATGYDVWAFQVVGNTDAATWADTTAKTTLTIGPDVVVDVENGLGVWIGGQGATLNVYGTINSQNDSAIFGNGTRDAVTNNGGTEINIYDGAAITAKSVAIYQPQLGTVNITGGTVEGYAGIGIKSGTLNITGGTVRGVANDDVLDDSYSATNGIAYDGSAIVIDSYIGYSGQMNLTISGDAVVQSLHSTAIHEIGNVAGATNVVNLKVEGGSLSSASGKDCILVREATKDTVSVTAGTFTQDLSESEYLADTVRYQVTHDADGSFSYAGTLAAAQAAAQPGDTITDLKAAAGNTATLTLKYNDGTTADVVYTVEKNTGVALPAPSRTGYTFAGWSDGTNTYAGGTTYTVAGDANLTAQWSYNGGGVSTPTYAVSVESASNGTVTTSTKSASKGTTVTVTVKPDEGYVLDALTVTDKDGKAVALTDKGDGKYTFQMPASKVTVKAAFKAEAQKSLPFTDVAESAWYYDAVSYVYGKGIMTGTNDGTTFSPAMNLTRGMMTQILYNLEGNPDLSGENLGYPFADVPGDSWYADGVYWARQNGIVDGYGDNTFGPEDPITREQMAVLLYNYARYKGNDVTASADLTSFSDSEQVSDWAVYAMKWAVAEKLIQGSNNALNPLGTATRAEVAQLFTNLLKQN